MDLFERDIGVLPFIELTYTPTRPPKTGCSSRKVSTPMLTANMSDTLRR